MNPRAKAGQVYRTADKRETPRRIVIDEVDLVVGFAAMHSIINGDGNAPKRQTRATTNLDDGGRLNRTYIFVSASLESWEAEGRP